MKWTMLLTPFSISQLLQGAFSFDDFFQNIVTDVLPPADESKPFDGSQSFGNGSSVDSGGKGNDFLVGQPFAEAGVLLPLCRDARSELVELCYKVDSRLENLKDEVSNYDSKHEQKFAELENGVAALFESFSRLDSRISGVGQTAARIGDHLQNADAQRKAASQTIDLIKYLMEFNGSLGDLMELSSLFTDDARVAEAAAVAQKLRLIAEEGIGIYGGYSGQQKSGTNVTPGLEVAVSNLQDYCNELENRLLIRFDNAAQKWELSTMAECAKILSQFNRGSSAMQRYVASRPMFLDAEIMNLDARTVKGEFGPGGVPNVTKGLQSLYKEIAETVRKEAATVSAVFPSPDAVMAILVQRVMEQRVDNVVANILPRLSLTNPRPMEDGGFQEYLRILAGSYEKTQELAKELHAIGCGDLDVEGLAESLFSSHREDYVEIEQASLTQLFQHRVAELKSGIGLDAAYPTTAPRLNSRNGMASANTTISVTVVGEFVQWNEEAIARCTLLTPQAATLATNVRAIFLCLLDQVSQYTTEGLERAMDALNEAAQQRNLYSIGSTVSRRVAAAAATAAEAAAAAGERAVRGFMVAVQRATSNVALVQQHFVNSVARLLLPVDGAHASCCEEMATAMALSEASALKGLQICIDTIMAEVDRLLAAEQKAIDYKPTDDGNAPDHRPTNACTKVTSYLEHMLEAAYGALEGLNKQAFMTELGNRLYKGLLGHWQRFTFSASGGLRLKRDVSEYAEFVRSFKAPAVDEKFELLGTLVNVFIVAPDSLPTLVDSSLKQARAEAMRFIELREDYRSAKIASRLTALVH
uniref:Exocyst complex component Sec10 n=1 Tax=Physcomitrium patens TaxID=3218 RepID=A0A7I4E8W1_PHYPA